MRNVFRIIYSIIFLKLIFIINICNAQLIITPNQTAAQMVTALVGGGLTFSNATFSGATNSSGTFTTGGTPTNLGFASGIVLSTGSVLDAVGPNLSGSTSTSFGNVSDPQLAALIPGYTINDACYLQFDFIPQSDTVKFRYVFGSEEYPEWVGSSFNDVFGFFISGPNPGGGNYNFQNIAIIPGTTLPVTIDNVNSGSYSQYYVDNTSGLTVQFDGFTAVLTAWCVVTPCVQYTIKIAVGDAGDSAYDSAVFLEENSFTTNGISMHTSYSNSADTAAVKGCSNATVTFSTSSNVAQNLTINYTVGGSAVPGVDYVAIPNSATIPAGQDSVSFDIVPIFSGLSGPTVEVVINNQSSVCANLDSVIIFILNNELLYTQSISNDTTICGGVANLFIHPGGGIPPYVYAWDTGDTTSTITVNPTQNTVYTVFIADNCGQTLSDQITVTVGSGTGTLSNDTLICPGGTATLVASGAATYAWSNGNTSTVDIVSPTQTTVYYVTYTFSCGPTSVDSVKVTYGSNIGAASNDTTICTGGTATLVATGGTNYIWSNGHTGAVNPVHPTQPTKYYVTIQGACGGFDSVKVNIMPLPVVSVKPPDQSICKGASVSIVAGGGVTYSWSANPGDVSLGNQVNLQAISVSPSVTTTYTVISKDSMGCRNTSSASVTLIPFPTADFFATPKIVNILEPFISFFDNSSGAVSWSWNLGDGTISTAQNLDHVYGDTGTFQISLLVKNQFGCKDSVTNYVMVRPNFTFYVPNSFTPNGDFKNDVFHAFGEGVVAYELRIFDRWGKLIFITNDINIGWDGKINGGEAPVGVYFYKINYTDGVNKKKIVTGNVTLLK